MLKGELVVKNQRLADCEISTRLQEVKKNVLDQQKSELMKEKQQLTDNLVVLSRYSIDCLCYGTVTGKSLIQYRAAKVGEYYHKLDKF